MKVLKKFLLSVLFACSFMVLFNSIDVSAKTPKFSSKEYTIKVGESKKLKLKNANKNKVKWIVENTDCITITSKGTVKGIKEGSAVVMAKYKGKYYSTIINVKSIYPYTTFYEEVKCPLMESWELYESNTTDTYKVNIYITEDLDSVNYVQVLPLENEDYYRLFTSENGCKTFSKKLAENDKFNGKITYDIKKEANSDFYYSIISGQTNIGTTYIVSRCIGNKYVVLYSYSNPNYGAIPKDIKETLIGLSMSIEFEPKPVPVG